MFPLIFCIFCVQKFWHVRTFSGNSPRIKAVFVSEIRRRPKTKVFTQNRAFFCLKFCEGEKKGPQSELERFLCRKSLLSALLL